MARTLRGIEGLTALVAVSGIVQPGAECSVAQAAGLPFALRRRSPAEPISSVPGHPLGKKRRSAKRCDVGAIGRRYRHPGLLNAAAWLLMCMDLLSLSRFRRQSRSVARR